MSEEFNELKVLLAELAGEIRLGEEKLRNKATTLELNQEVQLLTAKMYTIIDTLERELEVKIKGNGTDIKAVDKRLNNLYLKIAGATTILVALIELILKSTKG